MRDEVATSGLCSSRTHGAEGDKGRREHFSRLKVGDHSLTQVRARLVAGGDVDIQRVGDAAGRQRQRSAEKKQKRRENPSHDYLLFRMSLPLPNDLRLSGRRQLT